MRLDELVLSGRLRFMSAKNILENYIVAYAMRKKGFHVTKAAQCLKINRTTLSEMLRTRFKYHSAHCKKSSSDKERTCPICNNFFIEPKCPACPRFDDALALRPLMTKR